MTEIDCAHPEIVFADAMDWLPRSQDDIATLYERLTFRGIQLITRKENVVTVAHRLMGTINAQQVSATSDKTHDALRLRPQMGQSTGGRAYDYDKVIQHDAAGERMKGLLAIVPAEAAVIVGIFEDYAAGMSPKRIVTRLNAAGLPPPRSGRQTQNAQGKPAQWGPNTIIGSAARGTGLLNNECYIGRRPYGKQTDGPRISWTRV